MGAGAVSLVARVEVLCIHTRMYTNKCFLNMMQSGKISWSVSIVHVTVKLNILVRRNTDTLELTQS